MRYVGEGEKKGNEEVQLGQQAIWKIHGKRYYRRYFLKCNHM